VAFLVSAFESCLPPYAFAPDRRLRLNTGDDEHLLAVSFCSQMSGSYNLTPFLLAQCPQQFCSLKLEYSGIVGYLTYEEFLWEDFRKLPCICICWSNYVSRWLHKVHATSSYELAPACEKQ
jgi:hypothetical protein